MSNSYTGLAAGSLTRQLYTNFRGVDFTDSNVAENRSPDALNMWKNYRTLGKKIETRPDIELQLTKGNTIFGLFFYTINQVDHWIIHCGTSLIDYNPNTKVETILKETGMNPRKSVFFIYNNLLFIKDGINYLEYNGTAIKDVVGTIPITTIANKPSGGGKQYQDVNLLSDYRKNSFWGDGESTEYHLDTTDISSDGVQVWISDVLQASSKYSVDTATGVITFVTAPEKAGNEDNVVIQFKKVVPGYADKVKKCTLACMFDNRIFFSGNQDYPNTIMWCTLNNPRYVTDMNYALEGTDIAQIKALVPGNNALWVFKEPSQANTTVFYHNPLETTDERLNDIVKVYPSNHSSISTGCIATGINFNDDICFFSDMGLEGISGDITTEQVLGHRSTLVDRKLLNEDNYKNMILTEYEGYLFVIVDNHIYLADSHQKVSNNDHVEYEWFYWELDKKIKSAIVNKNILYLCSEASNVLNDKGYKKYTNGTNIYWYDEENTILYDESGNVSDINVSTLTPVIESGIYTLTNNSDDREINSYWTTKQDDCNYPQLLKQTNKNGFKVNLTGETIKIEGKKDNEQYNLIGNYNNNKGYVVTKVRMKKWNTIQFRFSSNKPFGIYEVVYETYIGNYIKRG